MSTVIRHALIMAAGRGVRMMPLTAIIPKPMAPYQGSTLIANGIARLKPLVQNIHITVGYKGAMLAEHVIAHGVASVFDTSERGNAWWVYHTLMKHLDEPVLVLTCDNVIELDVDLLAREYDAVGCPACMVVPVTPVPSLEGDYLVLKGSTVVALDRYRQTDRYCSGMQVLNPAAINRLTASTEDFYQLWAQLIAQRRLYAANLYPGKWLAVDTIEQLSRLNGT